MPETELSIDAVVLQGSTHGGKPRRLADNPGTASRRGLAALQLQRHRGQSGISSPQERMPPGAGSTLGQGPTGGDRRRLIGSACGAGLERF